MRENMGLYRGKRQDTGEWVEGYLLRPNPEVCRESEVNDCIIGYQVSFMEGYQFYDVVLETVGQFTGLTDKNGKKIFEGDIVKAERICNGNIWTGCVAWWNGCFAIQGLKDGNNVPAIDLFKNYEVIGNVHDNPDLIGVSK